MIKFKKIFMAIIISLFVVMLTIPNMSNAANKYDKWNKYVEGMKNDKVNVGDTVVVDYDTREENQDSNDASKPIYCIQNGQHTIKNGTYKIVNILDVKGWTSTGIKAGTTDKKVEDWIEDREKNKDIEVSKTTSENAKLMYILNLKTKSPEKKRYRQVAIWKLMGTWREKVGKLYRGHSAKTTLYDMINKDVPNESDGGVLSDATKYASDKEESSKKIHFEDNTDKSKLSVAQNGDYTIIGPFKWTFDGEITAENIKVNDMESSSGDFEIGKWKSGKWEKATKVTSASNFYISVKSDKLTDGKINISIKATKTVIEGKLYFLYKQNAQNFMTYNTKESEVTKDLNAEYSIQGNLKVIKVDEDNNEVKLKGVGFKIKNEILNKYVNQNSNGDITYVDEANATEFVTDEKGEISINNLIIGKYVAYETKNPNVGYEITNNGQSTNVTIDKTATLKINNKKVTVDLSGFVWKDMIDGKSTTRNNLYSDNEYDTKDELMGGVTVRLIDRTTGEVVSNANGEKCETTTKESDDTANNLHKGQYRFKDILVKDLSNYYVQFEYDGIKYTNVEKHKEKDNGSKATEANNEYYGKRTRKEFNAMFESINGKDTMKNGKSTGTITGQSGNYNISYTTDTVDTHAVTEYTIDGMDINMSAETDSTYIYERYQELQQKDTSKAVEEITFINLGVYEREQPDIAIQKDVQNVKLSINGYNHVYEYGSRFKNAGEYNKDGDFNVGVKFGSKYNDMSYTQTIYKSDVDYDNKNDTSKNLGVYVTYRIALKNQSSSLTTKVNSIVDYFDSKYIDTIVVGTELDEETRDVTGKSIEAGKFNSSYKKAIIDIGEELQPQAEKDIYIQFKLNEQATLNILNEKPNLDNVVEINSYSVSDKNGTYAGIDVDSAPANCVPGELDTYEDDTDKAPALLLEVQDGATRKLSGTVFEDEATVSETTISDGDSQIKANTRQGDGIYDSTKEHGIKNVTVNLVSTTTGEIVKTMNSVEDGSFEFSDIIPDKYQIQYIWGGQTYNDITYTVQNYKSTIYHLERGNDWWEKEEPRYSDAKDYYGTETDDFRKKVENGEINEITASTALEMPIDLGIEKGDKIDTITTIVNGDKFVRDTYETKNIDFGIVERPRQEINIEKRVSHIKITLANGQVLGDSNINKTDDGKYKIEPTINGVTIMEGDPEHPYGQIKAEIDSELIQGATVDITYAITVKNNSEIDYTDESYYLYGTVPNNNKNLVKITPTEVIDYLDEQMPFEESKNTGWEIVDKQEYINKVNNVKDITINEKTDTTITTDTDGNITKVTTTSGGNTKTYYSEEEIKTWKETISSKRTETTANRNVLKNELEKKELRPGESETVNLQTSKVLSNGDEIDLLENHAELTKVETTGGRNVSLINKNGENPWEDWSERIIVTPPAGKNNNYLPIVILGISACVILGAGVVIIKKKVLK